MGHVKLVKLVNFVHHHNGGGGGAIWYLFNTMSYTNLTHWDHTEGVDLKQAPVHCTRLSSGGGGGGATHF